MYIVSNCTSDKLQIFCGSSLGGVVRKLTHLTSSISLDYFKFMNEVEQITYYAAQQAEAALSDYIPQTVMVRIKKSK